MTNAQDCNADQATVNSTPLADLGVFVRKAYQVLLVLNRKPAMDSNASTTALVTLNPDSRSVGVWTACTVADSASQTNA